MSTHNIQFHDNIRNLMSTHNIKFHDKIRKFSKIVVFLSYRKNFVGTQKLMGNRPSVLELLRFDSVKSDLELCHTLLCSTVSQ